MCLCARSCIIPAIGRNGNAMRPALTAAVLALAPLLLASAPAAAQAYPDRPIKIVVPIGPGGTPVFALHQMCSAKLGSDPRTSVARPNGELHDTTGVWIADASGMPCCSGVNPMVSVMALARRTATNMLNQL